MRHHRQRAEKDPSFLSSLLKSYGDHPLSWSLQEVIYPLEVSLSGLQPRRRSQIRAYVVLCQDQLFLYRQYEVRLPSWDIDLNATLAEEARRYSSRPCLEGSQRICWSDPVEQECCGESYARPYNEKRSKGDTERYLLDEISALLPCKETLEHCLVDVFSAMQKQIIAPSAGALQQSESTVLGEASLAILGVDLLVSSGSVAGSYRVSIVEVNNNPAMPRPEKQMSEAYHRHLVTFVRSVSDLAAYHSLSSSLSPPWDRASRGPLFDTVLMNAFHKL
eukprot:gene4671-5118_t